VSKDEFLILVWDCLTFEDEIRL